MLLVFDLNGVLVHSQFHRLAGNQGVRIGNKQVWLRPGARELLLAMAGCRLAIWSSMQLSNVQAIVQHFFADIPFEFVWGREHCQPAPNYGSIKDPRQLPGYPQCVIFDDSPEKIPAELQRQHWWRVPTYRPELSDDQFLLELINVLAELPSLRSRAGTPPGQHTPCPGGQPAPAACTAASPPQQ